MLCWTLNGEYYMCCTAKSEITSRYETFAFVVGLNDDKTITKDVVKINLLQRNAITIEEELPTEMSIEAIAAVFDNTMFVAGIGVNDDEIWKYGRASGWKKCASL